MQKIKVLIVEDDASLMMVIRETLEIEGFEVCSAGDGMKGLEIFSRESIDVVVADIMMPNLDGIGMVVRMRQRDRMIPILFLTAKSSVESVVEGFEAGADDYIRKPFSMKELIVRIRALHARAHQFDLPRSTSSTSSFSIGRYTFDPVSQYLHSGDHKEQLSSRESALLKMLIQHVNEVVSSTDIMLSIWEDDSPYIANSLQVFITRLRARLKDDPTVRIVNARGIGYKLVVDMPDTTH